MTAARWSSPYGEAARKGRGRCTVPIRDGPLQGPCEYAQLHSGHIYLGIEPEALPRHLGFAEDSLDPIGDITGITSRRRPFSAQPLLMVHAQFTIGAPKRPELHIGARSLTLGRVTPATSYRYGFTNVVFMPNESETSTRGTYGVMRIDAGDGRTFLVRPFLDTREQIRIMRAQHATRVTCEVEYAGPEAELATLGALLSLANGTVSNWIWRDSVAAGRISGTHHEERVTRPYTGLPMLPTNDPRTIPSLVRQSFDTYSALSSDYRLNTIIRLLATAREGRHADLESRGVTLAIILEVLCYAHGLKRGITLRMPPDNFKEGIKRWRPVLKQALNEAYPEQPDHSSMLASVEGGLNRTEFREVLHDLASSVGVSGQNPTMTLRQTVQGVVKSRNKLIHEGRFVASGEAVVEEFFDLLSFVDRLVLKLLGYSGPYQVFKDGRYITDELP